MLQLPAANVHMSMLYIVHTARLNGLLVPCLQVGWYQLCGGLNAPANQDAADGSMCCPSGAQCMRINEWHWQCDHGSGPAPGPSPGGSCQQQVR
jgi:hypothetical protein